MRQFWVKVSVKKIIHSATDSDFFIGVVNVIDSEITPFYKVIKIKGYFDMLFEGDILKAKGYFQVDKHNENIFHVLSYILEIQQEEKSIIKFFQQEKKGIRKAQIQELISTLGISFISDIYRDNQIIEQFSFSPATRRNILEIINRRIVYQEIINFLILNNLSPKYANPIYKKFGENAIKVIQENPYTLYYSAEIPYDRLDRLAHAMKFPYDFFGRIDVGIFHYIDVNMDSHAHVFVYKSDVIQQVPKLLKTSLFSDTIQESEVEKVLNYLIKKGMLIEVEHDKKMCIYKKYIYVRQNYIIDKINEKLKYVNEIDEIQLDGYLKKQTLSNEQKQAIFTSLKHKISVVTGGPGTGKTYTLRFLYETIKCLNPDANILTLAPTGRASRKIEDIVQRSSYTVHRGLGLRYSKEVKEEDFLEEEYIIIDESSMIDLLVFYSLIKAIPVNTTLILVGDVDQLPSIGIGNVLSDLIESGKIPVSRLSLIFRQSKDTTIAYHAKSYLEGSLTQEHILHGGSQGFYFLDKEDKNIYHYLMKSIRKLLKRFSWEDIAIITPIKNEFLGVYELNALIQAHYNPNAKIVSAPKIKYKNTIFLEGDKVMHTKNDYKKGIMNGCIGFIQNIDMDNHIITAQYDDLTVIYSEKEFDNFELAYACTIYKSQGSEYPVVIFLASTGMDYGLNRNSIYTAWTRPKDMLITVGSFKKVMESWNICEKDMRHSYLAKLL